MNRRHFLRSTAVAGAALATTRSQSIHGQDAPNRKLRVGIMGLSRGRGHITGFLGVPNVEIAYVCDIDEKRLATGKKMVTDRQSGKVRAVTDFRRIIEDPEVDILSIAAPNFWHAPATVMACRAGKHVYVEKPGSHNPYEGKLMVKVARETERKVQMGTQRRSYPSMIEGIAKLREGAIGKILYSRCHYKNLRGSIGKGKPASVPEGIDYKHWQGPTPERPFKDNILHYNWHWHWHYGGGELLNNGVHALDIARWGLGAEIPSRVSYFGSRYHHDDDQETPDTGVAQFDFGDYGAAWEGSSCHPRKPDDLPFVAFYGEGGMMRMTSAGYTLYDEKGKEVSTNPGQAGDIPHFQNFCDAIRLGTPLNQPIESGQISTLWCHLGNIAYRTNSVLDIDTASGQIKNNPDAMKLWKREYSPEFEKLMM